MAQWNHDLLGRLVAPGIADFNEADIPDVAAEFSELKHWIANHFLNSVFGTHYQGKARILIFNFIHRSQTCLLEYDAARTETAEFIRASQPSHPSISRYFRALARWEISLLNLSISIDLFRALIGQNVFEKLDQSPIQRAYDLANSVKHYGTLIAGIDPIPPVPELLPAPENEPSVIPLWLSNTGLHSGAYDLTFPEYGDCVRSVAQVADKFTNPGELVAELKANSEAENLQPVPTDSRVDNPDKAAAEPKLV